MNTNTIAEKAEIDKYLALYSIGAGKNGSRTNHPRISGKKGIPMLMLSWSVTFLIGALIAALFGFSGIAGEAAGIAKVLSVLCFILFLVSLVFTGPRRKQRAWWDK